MLALTLWLAADAATEGKKVITGMLIVGLIFIGVIALGETTHWLLHRRSERRVDRRVARVRTCEPLERRRVVVQAQRRPAVIQRASAERRAREQAGDSAVTSALATHRGRLG